MSNLQHRKESILRAVVNGYVETAVPIGSEWLIAHYDFGCKSATLRNEMADLSDQGYLLQPHTSAGRIPSDTGYRYYVNQFILSIQDTLPADAAPPPLSASIEVEEMIQQTCRQLAEMTQYPSVASPPTTHSTVMHKLYLTSASPRHVLLVMLLSSGHVEHRILEIDATVSGIVLERICNLLNERFSGKEVSSLSVGFQLDIPSELINERTLLTKICSEVSQTCSVLSDNRVYVEGTSHIFRQREFQDVTRLEQLLSVLERSSLLNRVFSRMTDEEVMVIIGAESPVEEMQECSVVASRYHFGPRNSGYIGVFGPTRMHYARTVQAVALMAKSLTWALSRASLE